MSDPAVERRAMELFMEVVSLPPPEQEIRLRTAIDGDTAVLHAVRRLLEADQKPRLREKSVAGFLADQVRSDTPPEEVDHEYRILRVIGEGSSGTVYEAEEDAPRRRVAIKAMRAGLRSAHHRKNFSREARILSKLDHPNIAKLYHAELRDEDDGARPYLVMQYIDGLPLDQYAASRALSTEQKLSLFRRICDPLTHAHKLGILHRDLKPANILIAVDGTPTIVDFGIACTTAADLGASLAQQTGQLVGTLAYMSPEQLDGGGTVDERTDVYSLGVILYELLTGHLPIDIRGMTLLAAVRRLGREKPLPVSAHDSELAPYDSAVARAIAELREDRYPSISEFCQTLGVIAGVPTL